MGITKIIGDLAPFFKYATSKNQSNVVSKWEGSGQRVRTHLVYQNCVACNVPRFTSEQVKELALVRGTDTYFCRPCSDDVVAFMAKTKKLGGKEAEAIQKAWEDSLFYRDTTK